MPKKNSELTNTSNKKLELLYSKISSHIDSARQSITRTVNVKMVKAYRNIGQEIVDDEQGGHSRAEYGKSALKKLSNKLQRQYKRGFSVDTLELARKFYIEYQLDTSMKKSETASRKLHIYDSNLSWSHYVELMRVPRDEARQFYQIEASKNRWSLRELKRQIGSLLFDRIAKSKDKQGLMKLAYSGQEINEPKDAIKDPMILEFLGISEAHKLVESKLEQALIDNLQHFLLELGKGFAFVGRQKRLSFDGDHFYADLVFYHIILKCYVIIDIKMNPLSHGDLGQMLLYVITLIKKLKVLAITQQLA